MDEAKHYKFLNQDINKLVGVGSKIKNLLKKKKIEKISDLIWSFPHSFVDRSNLTNLDALKIGKVTTIKVKVIKYNIPRIKNLPNKVLCKDEKGQIDIIFFNSREGYIRKILPINEWVVISGKVNFYNSKDVYLNYEDGEIQFRGFGGKLDNWQGELGGAHAKLGKIGRGSINAVLKKPTVSKHITDKEKIKYK